jgi:hypothetical protein
MASIDCGLVSVWQTWMTFLAARAVPPKIRENKQTNPTIMIHFFFAFMLFPPFLHQVLIVT